MLSITSLRRIFRSAQPIQSILRTMSTLNVTPTSTSSPFASQPTASPSLRSLKPPSRFGMKELDRSAFDVRIDVIAIRVLANKVGKVLKDPLLAGQVMDIAKLKTVVFDPDPRYKRIILRVSSKDELPLATREFLDREAAGYVPESIELGYDHWTVSDILNSIMASESGEDVPSSYTQTGHIAHLNLLDEWLPYKHLIGQVILDKVSTLRTVVNKLNTIHSEYRYFDMEVIAGEPDFITSMNESNCSFTFDFSRVYWNSRLHHEHERLISLFQPNQVVADVMAGVGPFAIPAAKKGCYVLGNDLNPESVKWMKENRLRNKVEDTLRVSNIDGRDFIKNVGIEAWKKPFKRVGPRVTSKERARIERLAKKERLIRGKLNDSSATSVKPAVSTLTDASINAASESISTAESILSSSAPRPPPPPPPTTTTTTKITTPLSTISELGPAPQTIDHFVMNLPDSALTFLDAFRGCFTPLLNEKEYDREKTVLPMIHVHCFTREMERNAAEVDICARASECMGYSVNPQMEGYLLHLVRSVAPNKEMYCLSFRLPAEIAYMA